MKAIRSGIFLATALPLCALAQSRLEISGFADIALRRDSGPSGHVLGVQQGLPNPSFLRFFGVEDLGDGLKASFLLEAGYSPDSGSPAANPPSAAPATGLAFGRTAQVVLGSERTGYVSLGRMYTPQFVTSAGTDPFGLAWLGGSGTVSNQLARSSNSIAYCYGLTERCLTVPPPVKGVSASMLYALSEEPGNTPTDGAGRQFGASASWGDGTWFVGYAFHNIRGNNQYLTPTAPTSTTPTIRYQNLVASYGISSGMLAGSRLMLNLNTAGGNPALKRFNWTVGAVIPFADFNVVRFSYGKGNDKTAINADVKSFQIAYQYNLSKRTFVYTAWGVVDNNPTARVLPIGQAGTYAPGDKVRSLGVGIRHAF